MCDQRRYAWSMTNSYTCNSSNDDDIYVFTLVQEKFEATIEKYRSEKRKLQRQCQKLEEDLKQKDNDLARTQAATEQLQGAFANFQKIGSALK